ncbi:pyridoxal phosphate-dependent aminotransferase [Riemerella anatipestifer]|uniref:Aminotransferase n=1 Tax=Riemerella anatipestifer (strain ATCC 11845 / DSM 15868 / JCM 9532 / NCTC 11014) TaxID=693978 RepID=E4TB47_RIEAD|nr:pyridoxal phosphate-dependent aminotransferase [Riemerella anatipestifer]ADQ81283.1 aminotransferase class I and II [Riemerella anatipestifer ATCC 11845 = DSM 15868]ADZ11234.1 Aspartate/tyrosine/aromatic aminotransferase [Riemerella anatipestifer RA-GD]AFD55305.1 aminotransferase class i and ii [Riemerella anatipestifer ATCC 11845 = DSM 15868]AKQ38856.1 aspartate aminotransferase [Riemerella anatipestifer Yb2]EFT35682.1 Aspartate aminotransferase [Riemerella anatipestifer RA-YM]
MSKLSKRVERLSYSQTFVMSNKARAMKAKGIDVISMTLGEPDFDVPEKIKLAAKKAIDDNYSHYSPITGFPELRQAICNKLKRDNNLEYSPSQICVSTGAKQSISNVLAALIDDEDEVILPSPYWVSYDEMVRMMGGNSVFIETSIETDFKVTPKQIEAAITPKTKAILFSSPCNPSGSFYTYEELEAIANTLAKYPEIVIISDEIYEFLNYEGKHTSIAQFPQVFNQTVVINGVSKAYAMTGWRIGYSAAPQWLASACDKIQGQVTSGANTIAQIASITALEMQPLELQPMIDKFKERRNLAHQLISEIPGFKCNLPKGAFYLFPDVSYYFGKTLGDTTINNSDDFAMFLLEKAHVATVGGVSFGDTNCIRLSYATSDEQIIEAMKRIKETLAKYNV